MQIFISLVFVFKGLRWLISKNSLLQKICDYIFVKKNVVPLKEFLLYLSFHLIDR